MPSSLDRRGFVAATAAAIGAAVLFRPSRGGAAAFPVTHSDADWHRILEPRRFAVLRHAATEAPFSSPLLKEHRRGTFVCAGCQHGLYSSATKFESGTGWPSFWKPLPNAVRTRADYAIGIKRTEVLCAQCGGHLGHVFDDGPKPTGLRYCMNGLALQFRPVA
jgi:peptide-methionine (R)-S-oxide reductase